MRDKFSKIVLMAALTLALASTATAQTYNGPVTQIDDFANGNFFAITGEIWYNFVVANGEGEASISNGEISGVLNSNGYVEIDDISIKIPSWNDWAQASIGLKAENNGISYDYAECSGFRYKYKGNSHRFSLQSEKDGLQVTHYNDGGSMTTNSWAEVTAQKSSFVRDTYDEAYEKYKENTADEENKKYKDIPLDFSKINDFHWTVRPSEPGVEVTGYLQIKDFECLGELDTEGVEVTGEECTANGFLWEDDKCKAPTQTPIRISQTPSKWNILAQTANNAIMLENLPKNAKIDVYNLQGKQIYSHNSENSQILRISVQTKGMYIVKISSGSETKTLRMAVK